MTVLVMGEFGTPLKKPAFGVDPPEAYTYGNPRPFGRLPEINRTNQTRKPINFDGFNPGGGTSLTAQGIPEMGVPNKSQIKPTQIRTRGPESLATQGRSMQQPQQRGGMFNQQNQFGGQQGQQGMQQMMQFMQQMMQMFSMMSGQNRSGGFGGGFGGQQQYQQPQRYQPQPRQQYQPPPRQQFQPVQQQYGQMRPQQPSPFAQSIRPRY